MERPLVSCSRAQEAWFPVGACARALRLCSGFQTAVAVRGLRVGAPELNPQTRNPKAMLRMQARSQDWASIFSGLNEASASEKVLEEAWAPLECIKFVPSVPFSEQCSGDRSMGAFQHRVNELLLP